MTTLQDVAARAGCSAATVCRVLNEQGQVSAAMVRKVRKAVTELGYDMTPERGGVRRRPAIGVLIPSINNPVFAASLANIQNRMLVAGYGVLIAQSNYDPSHEADAVAMLTAERPRGLILTVCNPKSSPALRGDLPPTVMLHNAPTDRFAATVRLDNVAAGRMLTSHILEHGHRRILFVTGEFRASDRARQRFEGYRAAMQDHGLEALDPLEISFIDDYDQLDLSMLIERHKPTAMIASNDLIALGVMGALRRQGLSVPGDVSVAGFDGISIGTLVNPVLTTVTIPNASMGSAAASMLLDITMNGAAGRDLLVDYALRPGGTVRQL